MLSQRSPRLILLSLDLDLSTNVQSTSASRPRCEAFS
jgi:hypothetical protein